MPTLFFALLLITISLGLLVVHLRAWRERDHGGLTDEDYAFFRWQYFRRFATSGLISVIGLCMLATVGIEDLAVVSVLWLVVLSLVMGVLVLASLDWSASRHFVRRHLSEHSKLRQQLMEEAKEYKERTRREREEE